MNRWLLLLFVPALLLAGPAPYRIAWQGLQDGHLLRKAQQAIRLDGPTAAALPPAALPLHAAAAADTICSILRGHGYYEAQAVAKIDTRRRQLLFQLTPGPLYRVAAVQITPPASNPLLAKEQQRWLQQPARHSDIISAASNLQQILANQGYPAAKCRQQVIADGERKQVKIVFDIDRGPQCFFGKTDIVGLEQVKRCLVSNNICWQQGELYADDHLQKTQIALLASGLFRSVAIYPRHTAGGQLPIVIAVSEKKHKTAHLAFHWPSSKRLGITLNWHDGNVGGKGNRCAVHADLRQSSLCGEALLAEGRWSLQVNADHQQHPAYALRSYAIAPSYHSAAITAGLQLRALRAENSAADGQWTLLALPLSVRCPLRGQTRLIYHIEPTLDLDAPACSYLRQTVTTITVCPLGSGLTLAQRLRTGALHCLTAAPLPCRFFASSAEELRGYKEHSISPVDSQQQLIGGHALCAYTAELRWQIAPQLSALSFLDLGAVGNALFQEKWYRSIGVGGHYCSPLGPLRCDIAFPLQRRVGIDPCYRIALGFEEAF